MAFWHKEDDIESESMAYTKSDASSVFIAPVADRPRRQAARVSPSFLRILLGILLVVATYVIYERVAVSANADQITHFQSYGDEMVAIGTTDDQPGFVLLARQPASKVSVEAAMQSNWLTGRRTLVSVHTPVGTTNIRLRRPHAIMVHEDGTVITTPVPWTLAEFDQLHRAADCGSDDGAHQHRCGQPLDDIARRLATWPRERIPEPLHEFVRMDPHDLAHVDSTKGPHQ